MGTIAHSDAWFVEFGERLLDQVTRFFIGIFRVEDGRINGAY